MESVIRRATHNFGNAGAVKSVPTRRVYHRGRGVVVISLRKNRGESEAVALLICDFQLTEGFVSLAASPNSIKQKKKSGGRDRVNPRTPACKARDSIPRLPLYTLTTNVSNKSGICFSFLRRERFRQRSEFTTDVVEKQPSLDDFGHETFIALFLYRQRKG